METRANTSRGWRYTLLIGLLACTVVLVLGLPPIAQDLAYHDFADRRSFAGIPNAFDVLSNLPFLFVGWLGLRFCLHADLGSMRTAWGVFFVGVALVSAGSAWYHWNPGNPTLVWDRLPMTVAFMGVFVALLGERIDDRLGQWLLVPAVIAGALSVLVWARTDDLRFYAWVQFAPLLILPVVLALFPSRYTRQAYLGYALGWYVLAKLMEFLDAAIFSVTAGAFSGHTLKHLSAAAACYCVLLMLRERQPA